MGKLSHQDYAKVLREDLHVQGLEMKTVISHSEYDIGMVRARIFLYGRGHR